jgi:hypothetical protein
MRSWTLRKTRPNSAAKSGLWILLLAGFPLFAAAANPCTPAPRVPGTPIEAPHAVFEAYVVEVHAPQVSSSTFGVLRTRRALVEVVRSFHGPYSPDSKSRHSVDAANACGGAVGVGCSRYGCVGNLAGHSKSSNCCRRRSRSPKGPFAALAYATGEPRRGLRRSLKERMRHCADKLTPASLSELRARARPAGTGAAKSRAMAPLRRLAGARRSVATTPDQGDFEHANGAWIEIMRYEAPTPTPARTRNKRSKSRALWAEGSGFRRPGVASADSTS